VFRHMDGGQVSASFAFKVSFCHGALLSSTGSFYNAPFVKPAFVIGYLKKQTGYPLPDRSRGHASRVQGFELRVGSLGIVRRRRSFDIWLKEFAGVAKCCRRPPQLDSQRRASHGAGNEETSGITQSRKGRSKPC